MKALVSRRPDTYYDADYKLCQRCNEIKPRDEFGRNGNKSWQSHCIPCRREYRMEWRKRNPEKAHKADRRNNLRKYYGITPEAWESMFKQQGRACAVCKRTTPNGHGWHTDHCHVTGVVRGILCHDCNVALGAYERTILPNLERFMQYRKAITWVDR